MSAPDMDRVENLLAQAGGIVDVLRASDFGSSGDGGPPARPESVSNSLWAVQEMLDAVKAELFPRRDGA